MVSHLHSKVTASALCRFPGDDALTHALSTAVLLSGCSAGGLATYLHADYVRSLLPRSVKRFKAAPVSGFFLDHSNVDGTPVYPSQMKNVFLMQNCTNVSL